MSSDSSDEGEDACWDNDAENGPVPCAQRPRREDEERANSVPFAVFVQVVDGIREISGPKNKLEFLFHRPHAWGGISQSRQTLVSFLGASSIFPLARLIVPDGDYERLRYHVAEAMAIKALYKSTRAATDELGKDATFEQHVKHATDGRLASECTLTVGDINRALDELYATRVSSERVEKVFLPLVRALNYEALVCFLSILLKRLRMGLRVSNFLKFFNPHALDLYAVYRSLAMVLDECPSQSSRRDPSAAVVPLRLHAPFIPMRASFPSVYVDTIMGLNDFAIEQKYDGERMLLHIDRTGPCSAKSRQGVDFSSDFRFLFHHIKRLCTPDVVNVIFDGEALVWSKNLNRAKFFDFMTLRMQSHASERLIGMANAQAFDDSPDHPFYVIYDVVFINNEDLRHLTLRERRQRLAKILPKPMDTVVEIISQVEVRAGTLPREKLKIVNEALDSAVRGLNEGLVLKRLDSPYRLGRTEDWLKIKPDRLFWNGPDDPIVLQKDLDMLVAGFYVVNQKFEGILLGVRDCDSVLDFDEHGKAAARTVRPLRKLSLKNSSASLRLDLEVLCRDYERQCGSDSELVRHWPTVEDLNLVEDREQTPSLPQVLFPRGLRYCDSSTGFTLANQLVVVEIIAAEVSRGFQLRFPRLKRVRRDLGLTDSTSLTRLRSLAGKLYVDTVSIHQRISRQLELREEGTVKAKRAKMDSRVVRRCRQADLSDVFLLSSVLAGTVWFVFDSNQYLWSNGTYDNDEAVKRWLASHGATVKQDFPSDTGEGKFNLAASDQDLRNCYNDAVLLSFVEQCVRAGQWREPKFGDFFFTTEATRARLGFGTMHFDHPVLPATPHTLRFSLSCSPRSTVTPPRVSPRASWSDADETERIATEREIRQCLPLAGVRAMFNEPDTPASFALLLGGGRIVQSLEEASPTHLVGRLAFDGACQCLTPDEAWSAWSLAIGLSREQ